MILVRYALVFLIIYLIIRAFVRFGEDDDATDKKVQRQESTNISRKKVSKEVGEYIDYEEVDKS